MRVLTKVCAKCGNEFTGTNAHGAASWRKRKYCSLQCKYDAAPRTAPILTKSCEHCGRKFRNRRASGRTIEPQKWAAAKYCSPECKWAASRGREAHNKGKRMDLVEQFFRHVDKNGPLMLHMKTRCWEWTGVKSAAGYGGLQVNNKRALAHRVSYMLHHGEIPEGDGYHGYCVCHRCDNPSCVNPKHLFLGSHFVNMRDRDAKNRRAAPPGSRHGMAKSNERDVLSIRELRRTGRYTLAELGEMFGLSVSMISMIVNRKNWTHL